MYNRGFEAGIFLRFIIDHYTSLPPIIAFVQEDAGSPVNCHITMHCNIDARLRCLRTDNDWGWAPLNFYFVNRRGLFIWRDRGEEDAVHACWAKLAGDFDKPIPEATDPIVSFYCCAYFAVTKSQILRHPLRSYAAAYDRIVNAERCFPDKTWQGRNITNFGNDKDTSAGAFEHLQHMLLGGQPLRMEPFAVSDWCLRFLPNNVCPGSPCGVETSPSIIVTDAISSL